jgi:hypothetical protein
MAGYSLPDSGAVTPREIYQLLINAGASTVQAVGIMANMINESSLNPEAKQQGTSDPGYGLVQWEASSYPGAASLITGNAQNDARSQVNFLAQTGGFKAASGSTASEAAGNFARNYEQCATCQPGQAQYASRVANAATVAGWISTGKWPKSAGSAAGSGGGTGTGSATPTCLIGFSGVQGTSWFSDLFSSGGGNVGQFCLFTRTEARALIGGMILTAGSGIMLVGLGVLVAAGFARSGAGKAAGRAVGGAAELAGAGAAVLGAPEIGAPIAAAGAGVRKASQKSGGTAAAGSYARRARTRSRQNAAEDQQLQQRGASNIRTARKPAGTLKPNRPGRVTSTRRPAGRQGDQPRRVAGTRARAGGAPATAAETGF